MRFRGKFWLIVVFAVIILLAVIQTVIDYISEEHTYQNTKDVNKSTDYCIFIEIEDKTLYLLQDGKCIKQYPISSGKSGLPSPLGSWTVTEKSDWGEGFGGRWLGLNVPWGTYVLDYGFGVLNL